MECTSRKFHCEPSRPGRRCVGAMTFAEILRQSLACATPFPNLSNGSCVLGPLERLGHIPPMDPSNAIGPTEKSLLPAISEDLLRQSRLFLALDVSFKSGCVPDGGLDCWWDLNPLPPNPINPKTTNLKETDSGPLFLEG